MKAAFTAAIGISLAFGSLLLWAEDNTAERSDSDFCKSINLEAGCHIKILTPPRLIHLVRPEYPMHGRKKKHGVVVLHATITNTGEVRDVKVRSGSREIAQAALQAVNQWRYKPSSANGVPVECQHDITINFTSDDGVLLGADDMSQDLPTEPSEDLIGMWRRGELSRVGGAVKPPKAVYEPDPEYSEMARKQRYQGTCQLSLIVGEDGLASSIWVVQPLGYGLDEKAIGAVRQWKFIPATKNGTPVAVMINVEVSFRLN